VTTTSIHPSAIVEPGAKLGKDVEIGPFAYIGAQVELGDQCRVAHHASINGSTKIGPGNEIFPFASIGEKTQDLKYTGEPTHLEIGARNVVREFVTINRGTGTGEKTVIGSDNVLLAYSHVAHNCIVGNHTVFSNNGTLAGHVEVGDYAIIGGLSAVHQFCRIGAYAMIGGCSKIVQDVPPFFIADGNPAEMRGLNTIGLQRHDFPEDEIKRLRYAFKILFSDKLNTAQAVIKLEKELMPDKHIEAILTFIKGSKRGIIR
jgi:UDP-N-acetylglucosamine acyltransferase